MQRHLIHISFQSVHFAIAEYSGYDGKTVGIDALFGPSREGSTFSEKLRVIAY
jgi:hypothetical protein